MFEKNLGTTLWCCVCVVLCCVSVCVCVSDVYVARVYTFSKNIHVHRYFSSLCAQYAAWVWVFCLTSVLYLLAYESLVLGVEVALYVWWLFQ